MKQSLLSLLVFCMVIMARALPYDSDLCVTHYDIHIEPDFATNCLDARVCVDVKNFSSEAFGEISFFLSTISDADEIKARLEHVFIQQNEMVPLAFENVVENSSRPSYVVKLVEPILPNATCRLIFDYQILGEKQDKCLPIRYTDTPELYLLTDWQWLPIVQYRNEPQRFPNIYKPSWDLTVIYPDTLTGVVDGDKIAESSENGRTTQTWKSVIHGHPQVFVGKFNKIATKQDDVTVEIYWPAHLDLEQIAKTVSGDVHKTFHFYTDLYGPLPGKTFRIIATNTPGGAHGAAMGVVMHSNLLDDIKTLTHEIAHTWWGVSVTSFGEGSKFLREGFANFSSALALQQLKGETFANNVWRGYKIRTLFNYYLAMDQEVPKCPLIVQEGYNPRMVALVNYTKGPLAINVLRETLGDDVFFLCLKTFTQQYLNQNINIHDFINTCNEVSQQDLTVLFKDLLWGTGYPSYSLVDFTCTPDSDSATTTVRIRNDGELAVSCPVLLKMPLGEKTESFTVLPQQEAEFTYRTEDCVTQVIIDPELTGYNYAPSEAIRFWTLFDNEYLGMTNWYWYNKSYAYYLSGDVRKAIAVLTDYLDIYAQKKNWPDIQTGAKGDFLAGLYLFCRGHYYAAARDSINAALDFKSAMPQLFYLLSQPRLLNGAMPNTGFVSREDTEKELLDFMSRLTGRSFSFSSAHAEERTKDIDTWKEWWNLTGVHKPFNLSAINSVVTKNTM